MLLTQPPSLAEACLALLLRHVDAIEALGVAVTVTDTMMRDSTIATALARTTLGAVAA